MLLEPKKAALITLTTVYLHNFLRKSPHSVTLYTPHGTMNQEVNGRIVEGNWRNIDNGNAISLLPIRNIPHILYTTVMEIRDEVAQFCQNEG